MIIPTGPTDSRMTTAKRQTLADFLYYSLCAGQTKAGPYGYSPLPLNLVQAGFEQIAKLKVADPLVDLTDRDVRSCNNPTFDGKNLVEEQAGRDRAPAGRVRQGRRGAVRHRHRHQRALHRRPGRARVQRARRWWWRYGAPGHGTDRHRSGRRPRHRRGDHARPRDRCRRRDGHHGPAARRLPGADRARGLAARGHLDVRLGRRRPAGRSRADARAARRACGAVRAAEVPSEQASDQPSLPARAVRGLRRLAPRRDDAGADAGRRHPGLVPTDNVQRGGGSSLSLTKTLTRTFVNDDGSTYEFPANTVTVDASQTKDLRGRQRILVSWTGAQPSGGRASNPYGENGLQQEYPVVILQCRGTDDASLPIEQQVRPETCWTGSVAQRSQSPGPTPRPRGSTTWARCRPTRSGCRGCRLSRARTSARPRTPRGSTPT